MAKLKIYCPSSGCGMPNQLIGYICESEDVFQPIFAPIKGQIVTNAFTSCSRCTKIICTRMGPMSNAICLNCFETKEN